MYSGSALLVMILLWQRNGVVFFESEGNWILFFRATATVMLTTFALSIESEFRKIWFLNRSNFVIVISNQCINLFIPWAFNTIYARDFYCIRSIAWTDIRSNLCNCKITTDYCVTGSNTVYEGWHSHLQMVMACHL